MVTQALTGFIKIPTKEDEDSPLPRNSLPDDKNGIYPQPGQFLKLQRLVSFREPPAAEPGSAEANAKGTQGTQGAAGSVCRAVRLEGTGRFGHGWSLRYIQPRDQCFTSERQSFNGSIPIQ